MMKKIIEARRVHGVTLAQIIENPLDAAHRAERRLGLPRHNLNSHVAWELSGAVIGATERPFDGHEMERIDALCMLGVLDGYAIGRAQFGPSEAKRTFESLRALRAFWRGVTTAGANVLESLPPGLGTIVATILDENLEVLRAGSRRVARDRIANAVAAGLRLYCFERELDPEELWALQKAPEKKRATPRSGNAQVEPPPQLLEAVMAAPLDDAPRAVLGDWWAERHDPRGELIALQLGPRANAKRADALIKKHQRVWVAPFRPFISSWVFERGLLGSVTAPIGKLIAGQRALRDSPLREATLTGLRGDLVKVVGKTAPHRTLSAVVLNSSQLDAGNIGVVGLPFFSKLTSLLVYSSALVREGVTRLAAALPEGLTALTVGGIRFSSADLERLSRSPVFEQLTSLRLYSKNGLTDEALECLQRAPRLESLVLPTDGLTDEGIDRVASLKLPKLRSVDLRGNRLGANRALLGVAALTHLSVSSSAPREILEAVEARFS